MRTSYQRNKPEARAAFRACLGSRSRWSHGRSATATPHREEQERQAGRCQDKRRRLRDDLTRGRTTITAVVIVVLLLLLLLLLLLILVLILVLVLIVGLVLAIVLVL